MIKLYNRLHELLVYNPATGQLTRKCNCYSGYKGRILSAKKGNEAGTINSKGYKVLTVDGKQYRCSRIAWLMYYGYMPENIIDHINRIKTDNRICNLREVSPQCNCRNRSVPSNSSTGVIGVSLHSCSRKNPTYEAQIAINGKQISLGSHNDFIEAVAHRLAAEQCLDWPNCNSTSSAFTYIKGELS